MRRSLAHPLRRATVLAGLVAALAVLAAASPIPSTVPAVAAPAAIVGDWYAGTVSGVGYVDPGSGSWDSGGGEGLMYHFVADGSWSSAWLLTSRLFDCRMRVLAYREGVLAESDPDAGMIRLDARTASMHSEDTCLATSNYDRELPPEDEVLYWERSTDVSGDILLLRGPDTGPSTFRPLAG